MNIDNACVSVVVARIIRTLPDDWSDMSSDEQAAYVLGAAGFAAGRDMDRMAAIIDEIKRSFTDRHITLKFWKE